MTIYSTIALKFSPREGAFHKAFGEKTSLKYTKGVSERIILLFWWDLVTET